MTHSHSHEGCAEPSLDDTQEFPIADMFRQEWVADYRSVNSDTQAHLDHVQSYEDAGLPVPMELALHGEHLDSRYQQLVHTKPKADPPRVKRASQRILDWLRIS